MDNVGSKSVTLWSDRSLLSLYFSLACFARTATAAAIVSILILASENGIPSHQMGILAACLSAPHLLGPIWGRWLDMADDSRKLIVAAACVYSVFMATTALLFQHLTFTILMLLLIVCGGSAPYLMGGISGLLNGLFNSNQSMRRKAHAWDVCSYAVGTTVGPMIVAGLTSISDTQTAVVSIAVLPLISAMLIMRLPINNGSTSRSTTAPSIGKVATQIVTTGPLSRTMYLTIATSFSLAALPICAIFLAGEWGQEQASSATLVTLYGFGNLVGALCLIRFPNQKEPEQLMIVSAIAVSLGLLLVSTTSYYTLGLGAFFICGVANAVFFAASLAARVEYAPAESSMQVFMWIAAMKIAAVSIGSTILGYIAADSPSNALWVSFATILSVATVSFIHKRAY